MQMRTLRCTTAGVFMLLMAACSSGPRGVYSDPTGGLILELKSGGRANLTFMGDVQDCAFTNTSKDLTVTCKAEAGSTIFAIHDDGSLTGPPGSFMPVLRKRK